MSNLSDVLEGLGIKNAVGMGILGGMGGLLADLSGVLDLVVILNQNEQVIAQLQQLQAQIKSEFDQLHEDDKATRIYNREQTLHVSYALSDSVISTLIVDVANNIGWGDRSSRIEKCIQAIDQLDYDQQFSTLFDDEIYYFDWWSGLNVPDPVTTSLFTDRYTLPSYVQAVTIFIMVSRAFDPNFVDNYRTNHERYFKRMIDVHDISAGGMLLIPFPDIPNATCQWEGGDGGTPGLIYLPQDSVFRESTPWQGGDPLRPFGAVHVYTGSNKVGEFPPLPNLGRHVFPQPPDINRLFARLLPKLTIAAHAHRKALYASHGLSDLRDFIRSMTKLLGKSDPGPDPGRSWTLREVAYLLGPGVGQLYAASNKIGNAVDIDKRWWENYKLTGTVKARDVLNRLNDLSDRPSNPPATISFRQTLAKSTLDSPVADPLRWW
jgi:hypothetical protein